MTIRARNRTIVAGLIVAAVALAASLLPTLASPPNGDGIRDIHLVVRNMTFYLDGQTDPNPTIALRAGELVRITLRNEDAGMRHDFAVEAWALGTRILQDRGATDAVEFRVPLDKGTATYHCTPHSTMMRGVLKID
jgi:FtsP/CotA-like multicopper oxidase with cupredoxin domain